MIYAGGEASRLYAGTWIVRAWFTWPWGQPGEHDTEPGTYEACMEWLALAPHLDLEVVDPDNGRAYMVRVERAKVVPA